MVNCLIRNLIHQLFVILHTDYPSFIIDTDKDLSALGISKAAYPFEILISPGLFILDILIFGQFLLDLRKQRYITEQKKLDEIWVRNTNSDALFDHPYRRLIEIIHRPDNFIFDIIAAHKIIPGREFVVGDIEFVE